MTDEPEIEYEAPHEGPMDPLPDAPKAGALGEVPRLTEDDRINLHEAGEDLPDELDGESDLVSGDDAEDEEAVEPDEPEGEED